MKFFYSSCILILSALSILNCSAQKYVLNGTSCSENVLITFDEEEGDYNTIELPKKIKGNYNWVNVKLDEKLKDSFEVNFDGNLFEVKNSSSRNFFHKYDKSSDGVRLFIKSLDNNSCLEILLDNKYNLVIVNKTDNLWELQYSGYYQITWIE